MSIVSSIKSAYGVAASRPIIVTCSGCEKQVPVDPHAYDWQCEADHLNAPDVAKCRVCERTPAKWPTPTVRCPGCETVTNVPWTNASKAVWETGRAAKKHVDVLRSRPTRAFHCHNCNTKLRVPSGPWTCHSCAQDNEEDSKNCSKCRQSFDDQRVICGVCGTSTQVKSMKIVDSVSASFKRLSASLTKAYYDVSGRPHTTCPRCSSHIDLSALPADIQIHKGTWSSMSSGTASSSVVGALGSSISSLASSVSSALHSKSKSGVCESCSSASCSSASCSSASSSMSGSLASSSSMSSSSSGTSSSLVGAIGSSISSLASSVSSSVSSALHPKKAGVCESCSSASCSSASCSSSSSSASSAPLPPVAQGGPHPIGAEQAQAGASSSSGTASSSIIGAIGSSISSLASSVSSALSSKKAGVCESCSSASCSSASCSSVSSMSSGTAASSLAGAASAIGSLASSISSSVSSAASSVSSALSASASSASSALSGPEHKRAEEWKGPESIAQGHWDDSDFHYLECPTCHLQLSYTIPAGSEFKAHAAAGAAAGAAVGAHDARDEGYRGPGAAPVSSFGAVHAAAPSAADASSVAPSGSAAAGPLSNFGSVHAPAAYDSGTLSGASSSLSSDIGRPGDISRVGEPRPAPSS